VSTPHRTISGGIAHDLRLEAIAALAYAIGDIDTS
jgi:hypothetical protein